MSLSLTIPNGLAQEPSALQPGWGTAGVPLCQGSHRAHCSWSHTNRSSRPLHLLQSISTWHHGGGGNSRPILQMRTLRPEWVRQLTQGQITTKWQGQEWTPNHTPQSTLPPSPGSCTPPSSVP